jgi:hypothetical protein
MDEVQKEELNRLNHGLSSQGMILTLPEADQGTQLFY